MSRVILGLAMGALAASFTGTVHAADWGKGYEPPPVFKPAYPVEWSHPDPLTFEAGLRYSYGMGGQSFVFGGTTYAATDTSHALEAHLRIDDSVTSTYVRGHVGYGAITEGEYEPGGQVFNTGRLAYLTADFGYTPLDLGPLRAGFFAGYHYANESPADVGIDIHALRLGVTARAEFGEIFDVNAEAAIIPYAQASGTLRNPGHVDGGLTGVLGSLYGASGEVMLGVHPTDNFTVRGGVRASYLTGHVRADQPGEHSMEAFRWGPLVELTARF